MTTTRLPLNARRAIIAVRNEFFEKIEDIAFQIAMDTISDTDIPISEADFDDEDAMETIIRDYAIIIANQIAAGIKLQAMLLS